MKKIIRTLLAVTLSAALFGCGSSSAAGVPEAPAAPVMTDEDYVLETANAFMNALDSGNVQKALTYASQDLNDVFNIPELAEAKDSLKGIGFSEKSEKEFSDFIDSIMDKVFGEGIRSYKLNTPEKVSDTEYKVVGDVEVIDFENALDLNVDAVLDNDLVDQFTAKATSDGTDAAFEFLMSEIISRMDKLIMDGLKAAPSMNAKMTMRVTKEGDNWIIKDVDGLTDGATGTSTPTPTPAPPASSGTAFDSHGISFAGGGDWYELTGADAQGSTYATQNDNYNGTMVQVHFTEQSNPGINSSNAKEYVDKYLTPEVIKNYENAGYDSTEGKTVTVDGQTGAWVHGSINGVEIYELDVPVDTGDGNLTMLALVSVNSDQTTNLLREIVIK